MEYFRVLKEFDNKRQDNKNFYVANELYTFKEIINKNLNLAYMECVNIPKNKTYFCFGARFGYKECIK